MVPLQYPRTHRDNSNHFVGGLKFSDSYRWLETETEEVKQWQFVQGQLADHYVGDWPYFESLKKHIECLSVGRYCPYSQFAGGKWFRSGYEESTGQSGVIVSDTPYGKGQFVYLINAEFNEKPAFIVSLSPSPDGCLLAVGVCTDGSEYNIMRVIRVQTGVQLSSGPHQLILGGAGVTWLKDSSGFYFQAMEGELDDFKQQILFHCIATGEQRAINIPVPDERKQEYMLITLSPDGRYHLANRGFPALTPVAILDTQTSSSSWQPFITNIDGSVVGHIIDHQLIAFTDVGAGRGRIVSIPLNTETANDTSTWTELVPESEATIQSIRLVGNLIYISEFVDTYSRVRIADLTGKIVGEVPLPGKGTVEDATNHIQKLNPKGHPEQYLFGFSSLTESWGVYRYHFDTNQVETLLAPEVKLENTIVEGHWAVSSDGTRIPYHSVYLKSVDVSKPQPTLMYAYGGYNYANIPKFPGAMAAFIEAGGVYVHCHLRGGSEFGREWWEGGRMRNKQNCFDDVYAIAEDLIQSGRTTSQLLAINGRSNGGLMSGVVLTQRPDLWKAVVPQVPVLDLIGALRHPYGRDAIEIEYADPNNAEELKAMLKYSPYHLVQDGVKYPAVYLEAGATDPRCPPWHARKFGAKLQAATASDAPVFVRIWEDAGHGQATDKNTLLMQYSSWLAFVMRQLGMQL